MDKAIEDERIVLGSMFIGTTISYVLYGVTCCQAIWYFRSQSGRTSKSMKALILSIWIAQTLGCIFMFLATLRTFLSPAMARAGVHPGPCRYWTVPLSNITTLFHHANVEVYGNFIAQWCLVVQFEFFYSIGAEEINSAGGFGLAQITQSFKVRCNLSVPPLNTLFVLVTSSCRLFSDSIVVFTMCYMLYVRSLGLTRHTNTVKILRGLILWSISTGVLTWLSSILFLASFLDIGTLPNAVGIFYVRSGLYVNAMLAQLNARTRFRAMADATLPLTLNLDTISSAQQIPCESQPPLSRRWLWDCGFVVAA
ncbi:hypothetical protein BYT27DRAFT_7243256 [Phlegmacium glaucopus]|nr:hypothetical protein BYT27DRAFT_7243256 [Phlegmacium glaucopus]